MNLLHGSERLPLVKWPRLRLIFFIQCHFEEATVHLGVGYVHETLGQFVHLTLLDLLLQRLNVILLLFLPALFKLARSQNTPGQLVLLLFELFLFDKSVLFGQLFLLAHLLALEVTRLHSLILASLVARIELLSRHFKPSL